MTTQQANETKLTKDELEQIKDDLNKAGSLTEKARILERLDERLAASQAQSSQ